jgi:tRNA threonylcarbamoyladenosine biosynthesis protein TsaE
VKSEKRAKENPQTSDSMTDGGRLNTETLVVVSSSAACTRRLGRALGERLIAGDVLALFGGLGAGKTVFVKGLAAGSEVSEDSIVTSPTFVLISEYEGRLTLYHVDAYRLEHGRGAADFEALGGDEIVAGALGPSACVIEWADRVQRILPPDRLDIDFEVIGATERRLTLTPRGTRWDARRPEIAAALDHALKAK